MVVLRPAYSWDCPSCEAENFCRGAIPDLPDDELAQIKAEQGIQPWEEGDFVLMPDEVQCSQCSEVFAASHFKDA